MREPQVLLLDEPTSALDMHRQLEAMRRVRGLAQESGMLVLIALHDLNLVLKFADKVAMLSDGTLHDFGPAPRVLTPENSPPPSASRRVSNPARRAYFI